MWWIIAGAMIGGSLWVLTTSMVAARSREPLRVRVTFMGGSLDGVEAEVLATLDELHIMRGGAVESYTRHGGTMVLKAGEWTAETMWRTAMKEGAW